MTIWELSQMQDQIARRMGEYLFHADYMANVQNIASVLLDDIQSLATMSMNPIYLKTVLDTASACTNQIAALHSSINISAIETLADHMEQTSSIIVETMSIFNGSAHQTLLDSVLRALTLAEPYMGNDAMEKCEQTILPELRRPPKPRLTLSELLGLLTLLVTIYFGIIASLPDKQIERIVEQNEIIIEQQEEMIQLQKEDEALTNALDSLADSINRLTDEVNALREELERSNDPSADPGQPDAENGQQQDGNAQD